MNFKYPCCGPTEPVLCSHCDIQFLTDAAFQPSRTPVLQIWMCFRVVYIFTLFRIATTVYARSSALHPSANSYCLFLSYLMTWNSHAPVHEPQRVYALLRVYAPNPACPSGSFTILTHVEQYAPTQEQPCQGNATTVRPSRDSPRWEMISAFWMSSFLRLPEPLRAAGATIEVPTRSTFCLSASDMRWRHRCLQPRHGVLNTVHEET